MSGKLFFYKIYDRSGSFLATWNDATAPNFNETINSGLSSMDISLARPVNTLNQNSEVQLFNEVQCWINDKEAVYDSVKVYSGWIGAYKPVQNGTEQRIDIQLMPYSSELSENVWIGSGSSTFSFTGYDPAGMIINALDNKYHTVGGKVGSQSDLGTAILPAGRNLSYTFSSQTYRDVVDKAKDLSPFGTYWYVDADNRLNFKQKSTSVIHRFTVGKDITSVEVEKDAKQIANVAVGLFGTPDSASVPLYITFGSESGGYDGSKVQYGKRTKYFTDQRIEDVSTAKAMFLNYLDYYNAPLVTATVTIADSNGNNVGYDIETLRPGDTAQIRNPFRDEELVQLDDYSLDTTPLDAEIANLELLPMQITSVKYTLDTAEVTLSNKPPFLQNTIYDNERIMRAFITSDAPGGFTAA